jgi:ATP-dependent helicase/nuclease subunit B
MAALDNLWKAKPECRRLDANMNVFTMGLATVCRKHFLDEKWLVAPSLRIGHQWLDAVARSGQPWCNVRVKTLKVLALDLSAPAMAAKGQSLLSDRGGTVLVDRVWKKLPSCPSGYLSQLTPSIRLAQCIYSTLCELALAGFDEENLPARAFEHAHKARELAEVWRAFRQAALAQSKLDYAGVLEAARNRLETPQPLEPSILVIIPADIEATVLEQRMLSALPGQQRIEIPVDQPATEQHPDREITDAGLLSWILQPTDAPASRGDGSATMVRAVGEINEVRAVVRSCLAAGWPLDEVEVLYSDADTYLPLIYELFVGLQKEEQLASVEVPVTFADGIPCRFARPGRALALWLEWLRSDYRQATLVQMFREGLLRTTSRGAAVGRSRLASALASLPIGRGCDRYLRALDRHIISVVNLAGTSGRVDMETSKPPSARRLEALRFLRELIEQLLAGAPEREANQSKVLLTAGQFLRTHARTVTRLDRVALEKLRAEIEDMHEWASAEQQPLSLDVWAWLIELASQTRVLAGNPEPGKVHVAPLTTGGHSGRPHLFVLGLDDSRFPGTVLQDPVLLDAERRRLSLDLATAGRRLYEKQRSMARLLARLRGTVTLSYSCHDLLDDREMFPSTVLLAAHRIVSGHRYADQNDMISALPGAESFAPRNSAQCQDSAELWLWRLGHEPIREPMALVARCYPNLGRGAQAAAQRSGPAFTIFDGWCPQAESEAQQITEVGTITASMLETIGRCPLAYFFRYVLCVEPPQDFGADTKRWLDPPAFGSLVHTVLERFVRQLQKHGKPAEFTRDWPMLSTILEEVVAEYQQHYPLPSTGVFRREFRQIQATARIFLIEEEEYQRETGAWPLYLETTLGTRTGDSPTPLDTPNPVVLSLPDGRRVRASARIDRIDCLDSGAQGRLAIWDYKTGSPRRFQKTDPFQKGRLMQSTLYAALVAQRLRDAGLAGARVDSFGYFFPGTAGHGARVQWQPEELAAGQQIIQRLLQIVRQGAFLATDEVEDCAYCQQRNACGDVFEVADASRRKLEDPGNTILSPYRELRVDG